jgi:TonB family protein
LITILGLPTVAPILDLLEAEPTIATLRPFPANAIRRATIACLDSSLDEFGVMLLNLEALTLGRFSQIAAILLLLQTVTIIGLPRQGESLVYIGTSTLLDLAEHKVSPAYPAQSLRLGIHGVVVVQVVVAATGRIERADILESPDAAIGASVRSALTEWRFGAVRDPNSGKAARIRTKLFFYFLIREGRGIVLGSNEFAPSRSESKVTQASRAAETIDIVEWRRLAKVGQVTLLDLRDRSSFSAGHIDGAINIPEDELQARVSELTGRRLLILDCPKAMAATCSVVVRNLPRFGVTNFKVLSRD